MHTKPIRPADLARRQAIMEERYANLREDRRARDAVAGHTMVDNLKTTTAAALATMYLSNHLYGFVATDHKWCLSEGLRTLQDLAWVRRGLVWGHLGYERGDRVRLRLLTIVEEIESRHPSPGIQWMSPIRDAATFDRLESVPITVLMTRQIGETAILKLRDGGFTTVSHLAEAEFDHLRTRTKLTFTQITALQARLAEYLTEPPRRFGFDQNSDAEWDAAAPKTPSSKRKTKQ